MLIGLTLCCRSVALAKKILYFSILIDRNRFILFLKGFQGRKEFFFRGQRQAYLKLLID